MLQRNISNQTRESSTVTQNRETFAVSLITSPSPPQHPTPPPPPPSHPTHHHKNQSSTPTQARYLKYVSCTFWIKHTYGNKTHVPLHCVYAQRISTQHITSINILNPKIASVQSMWKATWTYHHFQACEDRKCWKFSPPESLCCFVDDTRNIRSLQFVFPHRNSYRQTKGTPGIYARIVSPKTTLY